MNIHGVLFASVIAGTAAVRVDAAVTPSEARQLGGTLTPVGAERAGNASGAIPAWQAIATPGAPPKTDKDPPIYTVSRANMGRYVSVLTEGHRKLLTSRDSYFMNVYASRRAVTFPTEIQEATEANARSCVAPESDVLDGCRLGFPFPIPRSGWEPIWNHKLRWRGEGLRRFNNQFVVQADGKFQQSRLVEELAFPYASIRLPRPLIDSAGEYLLYLSRRLSPPRVAGTIILIRDQPGAGSEGRAAWSYLSSSRLVRRTPRACCDNLYEGSDGHQFFDQADMFSGALEHYYWKLLGKQDKLISYDSNRLTDRSTRYADIIRPGHINQDLPRYELHRVWVVEAELKPGHAHTLMKRRFYLDEDSWTIVAVDGYNNRNELVQFQEGHLAFERRILSTFTVPEVIYHFESGRYFISGASNEDTPTDFAVSYSRDDFDKGDHFSAVSLQKAAQQAPQDR